MTIASDLSNTASSDRANWGAICALTLCVSTLIASEFMPISLLTPIATDLDLTEGQAGQAISVSGLFAVLTSLVIAGVTRRIDRRTLLLALSALMLVSGLIVAVAPNFSILIVGRAIVGVVIGGFWALSTATVMRLVPSDQVPRGLAVLNGGNALAATIAAPLGSFLGAHIGWRGAFFAVVPLAGLTLLWLLVTLPTMRNDAEARVAGPFALLRRPQVALGMLAASLFFMGQFALFTYLRPFLETVTGVGTGGLSLLLLILGFGGVLGSWLIGSLIDRWLSWLLATLPLVMALLAAALVCFGSHTLPVAMLLALWGMAGTAAPVAWWNWLARTLPNDAEAGGGLMVAVIQVAITAGAAGGGLIFDGQGYAVTFLASAAIFIGSTIVTVANLRTGSPASRCDAPDDTPPIRPLKEYRT